MNPFTRTAKGWWQIFPGRMHKALCGGSILLSETALSIPEILSLIFAKAPRQTQAACALVCKNWSEVTLDELWRHLEHIQPILNLITGGRPFYDHDENLDLIGDADWPRFRQYAIRVKSITFEEVSVDLPWEEGVAFLGQHHPFGNCLTPKVRRLHWTTLSGEYTTSIMPFVSHHLKELRLEIHLWQFKARDLFSALIGRTPSLKKLSVKSELGVWPPCVVPSFADWIETCLRLEEVHIPQRWHTRIVLAAFESLPKLFEFGIEWSRVPQDHMGVVVNMEIAEGQFRSLRRLGWTSGIKQATNLLQQTPRQLQGLTLDCWGKFSQAELVAFFTAVAQCCPDLDSLCLNMADFLECSKQGGSQERLSWEIFRPLLACKTLLELSVYCSLPCVLSTWDIEEMGAAWPKLEKLILCPDPDYPWEKGGTPISSLPCFAATLPRLRSLGLFFDRLEPPSLAGDLFPERQLSLKEFQVGCSEVPGGDPLPVGLYLASLFAVGTRPSIKVGGTDVRDDGYWSGGVDSCVVDSWKTVESLVHLTLGIKEAVATRFF
ncbi:hypothetical protein FRC04_001148 [Tulasnella sp. 424]|nr:hypothetical protein FRC04_001148 [Tulasnella sp. 424]